VILDTSALMSIVLGEPDAPVFVAALQTGEPVAMSAASWLEAAIVAENRAGLTPQGLDETLDWIAPEVVPVTLDQMRLAREAHRRFGKGRHKAGLNFGDCFAYALARERNAPLLFKGADFSETDVKAAI
jgi:ribonuclease VapC